MKFLEKRKARALLRSGSFSQRQRSCGSSRSLIVDKSAAVTIRTFAYNKQRRIKALRGHTKFLKSSTQFSLVLRMAQYGSQLPFSVSKLALTSITTASCLTKRTADFGLKQILLLQGILQNEPKQDWSLEKC